MRWPDLRADPRSAYPRRMHKKRTESPHVSVPDYLTYEESADVRHEYVRGEIYALTGTTARHNRIVGNIIAHLRAAERGTTCRTYFLDLKVRAAEDVFYYPDVLATCTPHDGSTLTFDDPCLVVEVTSPSTRRTDRGEKVTAYQGIVALKAYLIVEQSRRQVTLYTREIDGWTRVDLLREGEFRLPCPETTLSLDALYDGVDVSALQVGEPEPGENWLIFEAADSVN
jgi:Uma2 family endonuclease